MSTETAEAPPQSPFAAALEKVFVAPADNETPPPEKKESPKKEPVKAPAKDATTQEKKGATPRELFTKSEPAKEPAAPSEPKSGLDAITPPDFKGDKKAQNAWDVIKGEASKFEGLAKSHEAKVKELEAKLSESETLKTQLAERESKLKEYDEIVSRARLDDHPEFRREFIDGRQKIVDRAKAIIDESGGDPKEIETALNLKGKARVEALREASKDLDNFQSGRLGRAIDELNDLDERAQSKRDAAKKSYDELRNKDRQQQAETSATKARTRGIQFDEAVRRLGGELEVLQKSEGHDDWNARADWIVREAKAFVDAHPEADIEAEIYRRAFPAQRDLFLQADKRVEEHEKKIAELEAELKTIHGKSPSLAARKGQSTESSTGRPFMAALKATVGEE